MATQRPPKHSKLKLEISRYVWKSDIQERWHQVVFSLVSKISVINEEVTVPALFKSRSGSWQTMVSKLLARTVLEQWHALVSATVATRRYHPSTLMLPETASSVSGCVARPTEPEAPSQ
jgi:hypothetical protein